MVLHSPPLPLVSRAEGSEYVLETHPLGHRVHSWTRGPPLMVPTATQAIVTIIFLLHLRTSLLGALTAPCQTGSTPSTTLELSTLQL